MLTLLTVTDTDLDSPFNTVCLSLFRLLSLYILSVWESKEFDAIIVYCKPFDLC